MGIRVGIDLGTTFSAVAYVNEQTGKPEVIKNSFDDPVTPSVLCFQENGNVLFGEDAKNMEAAGDLNTAAFFKRNMGSDVYSLDFFGKTYTATDLSAILLKNLVKEAEQCSGKKIDSAVITVPAYFAHKERQATIAAGKQAGLDVLAIINEPTAAAFAYGLSEKSGQQTVLIYDLGGGTFDVTIARIDENKIDILGSDGNHELGGKDWDDCIARYLVQQYEEQYGIDLSDDPDMIASLLVTAENVKKQLTSRDVVQVPIVYKGNRGTVEITEEKFEEISGYLIGETKDLIDGLLSSLHMTWGDITGTILVGGSTRMRIIHDYVLEMSGKEPLGGVNVDEAVALGAAIRANIDDSGNVVGNLSIGGSASKSVSGLVIGAKAVSDVTAHALGMIAVSEDGERYINSTIIPKNTKIPAEEKKKYNFKTRNRDNELEVYVLQGAYEYPLDNVIIAKYVITGIEPVKKNPSVIEVAYRYTSNGTVDVAAVQTETGKSLPIRIENIPDDMSWVDLSPKDNQPAPPEVRVVVSVDTSGSMYGEPLEKAKEAINNFINMMDMDYTSIGVISFADSVVVKTELTYDLKTIHKSVNAITVEEAGIGNAAQPFTKSSNIIEKGIMNEPVNQQDETNEPKRKHSIFKKSNEHSISGTTQSTEPKKKVKKPAEIIKYLIVLTDGMWNSDACRKAISEANDCKKKGIEIVALGFGEADYHFLRKIASADDFAELTSLSELSGSFSKIAQAISDR